MPEGTDSSLLKFRQIPNEIRQFLLSDDIAEKRLGLLDKYGLDDEKWFKLTGLLNDIYVKILPLPDFGRAVAALGLAPEKAKSLALDFAVGEFLPLSDYLGDVDGLIRSLGGNPANYPARRVAIRQLTPTELLTEFLHDHPVSVPAHLERRLREILESLIRGVRKDDQAVTRLTRAEKIGGVEMPPAEAEELVRELDSKMAGLTIKPDVEAATITPPPPPYPKGEKENILYLNREEENASDEPAPRAIGITAQSNLPHPFGLAQGGPTFSYNRRGGGSRKGDTMSPEDEREAERVRAEVLPKVIPRSFFDLDKEIGAAAETVFAAYGTALPKDIQERFRAIVVSRLRGVRTTNDTRQILGREPGKGGMGFGSGLADRVTAEIEDQALAIESKRAQAMTKEKEAFAKSEVLGAAAKDESRKRGEEEELDRLYSALTSKKQPRPAAPANPAPSVAGRPAAGGNDRPAGKAQPSVPPPPAARPAATPKMHDVRLPAGRAVVPKAALAAVAAGASGPPPKLTGPVEELRNLTVDDFRRLSSDPAEACRRLTDKLELLEEQSYGRRLEGVRAWQTSQVNRLYLDILNAAFGSGKPIPTAIAEAMSAGKPTLTEREVHAIMEFNRRNKA